MEHDAWFFVGIFIFIFLIWVATGGPLHPIAFSGPHLAQPDVLGGGTYLQLPRANMGIGTSNVVLPGSTGSGTTLEGASGSGSQIPSSNATQPVSSGTGSDTNPFFLPSPYRNVISLSSYVSSASSTDPQQEYVQLSLASNASGPVTLTGWVLESGATSKAELIPKGTATPRSGVVNAEDDIILQPGDSAIIISGKSPVGASFRENKCTGYFGSFQRFSPSLSSNCPSPASELKRFYGDSYIHDPACIDYVDTLSSCQTPLSQTAQLSQSCQSILTQYLNYNGCIAAHRGDSDFARTTWRIYLGRTEHLWRSRHEIVKLLDDRGKLVTSFTY